MEPKRLYRSCKDRILGGVAGGLAEYLQVDSTVIRLLFMLALFSGIGVLAYIFAWLIIPEDPSCKSGKKPEEEIREKAKGFAQDVKKTVAKSKGDEDIRFVIGIIILAFGVLLLVQATIGWYAWRLFWPAVLILIGVFVILRK